MTLMELKASAYDILPHIEYLQKELIPINKQIASESQKITSETLKDGRA